jgi:hypothetical protein
VRRGLGQVWRQVEARGFCGGVQEAGYLARDLGAVLRLVSEEVFALGVCARWRRQVCAGGSECAARVPLTNADASQEPAGSALGFRVLDNRLGCEPWCAHQDVRQVVR